MKRILFLSVFYFLFINGLDAQTWKYKVKYSDFDGRYDLVYATGYGGSFPYQNPQFLVRNKSEDELYISGLGYTGCDNNSLILVFDRNRRYKAYGTPSTDNKALFIESVFTEGSGERLTIYHLLREIMKSSKMSVRFENDCGMHDFFFKLDGSTSALTKMFGNKIQNEIKTLEEDQKQMESISIERARLKAIMDSLDRIEADSIREWRTQIVIKRRRLTDSTVNYFLVNPTIDGKKVNYKIPEESQKRIAPILERNARSVKSDELLIGFDLQEMTQSIYQLNMIFKNESGAVQNKWLYKTFRLTDEATLIVY